MRRISSYFLSLKYLRSDELSATYCFNLFGTCKFILSNSTAMVLMRRWHATVHKYSFTYFLWKRRFILHCSTRIILGVAAYLMSTGSFIPLQVMCLPLHLLVAWILNLVPWIKVRRQCSTPLVAILRFWYLFFINQMCLTNVLFKLYDNCWWLCLHWY